MIHKPENQRRISELIRTIIELGFEWRAVGSKARTAINAFYDPIDRHLYTTYSSGLIQRESPRYGCLYRFKIHQGPVNRIQKTKKHDDRYDYDYTEHKCIKLMTEEARLERLLECLTTVKKRQWKTSKVRK